MNINVFDENSQLEELVVGNSFNFKSQINFRDLYDPISLYNYLKGSFPNKYKLQNQISNFKKILLKIFKSIKYEFDKFSSSRSLS